MKKIKKLKMAKNSKAGSWKVEQHYPEIKLSYSSHNFVLDHKVTTIVHTSNCFLNLSFSEGRKHDAAMLAESGLLQDPQHHAVSPHGHLMCLYGVPAYLHKVQLQQPFRNAVLTPQMQEYNARMSSVRESVEWLFGDIVNYFKFIDFKKNLKIGLSSIGKMYIVCAILRNALTCLYGNETSKFF